MLHRLGNLSLTPTGLLHLAQLLAAGAVVYAIVLIALTTLRLIKPPRRTYAWAIARGLPGDPSEALGIDFEDAAEPLGLGRDTPVWSCNGECADGPTIIVTHGWGSGRIEMLSRLPALRPHASRIILWDMPGHGDAPGLSLLGAKAVPKLRRLIARCDGDVVLYGWSLGAEVSLLAAASDPDHAQPNVRGLILEGLYRSGLTPAQRVMRNASAPIALNLRPALALIGTLAGDPFRRFRDLTIPARRIARPCLVLHGADDNVAPPADGRAIAEAANATMIEAPEAGHADVWATDTPRTIATDAVAAFMRSLHAESRDVR